MTLRLHLFGFVFTPKLLPSLVVVVMLPVLISLGFWQLDRAHFKENLRARQQQQRNNPAIALQQLPQDIANQQFRRIQTHGRYIFAKQFLLDNRVYQHKAGFEVITPMQVAHSEKWLLVNRGWIPRLSGRTLASKLVNESKQQQIMGFIKLPARKPFMLAKPQLQKHWPHIIQVVDMKRITQALQHKIYPFVVLLSPQATHGFVREWQVVKASPHKHYGYAVQWFALALTMIIIYFIMCCRRERDDNK